MNDSVNRINCSFILALLIQTWLLGGPVLAEDKQISSSLEELDGKFLGNVDRYCFSCHGKQLGEEKRIEAGFDLSELLAKDELEPGDSAIWYRVLQEVASKRMPPDEGHELKDAPRKNWLLFLNKRLGQKQLERRLLTPAEINYDHQELFGYQERFFDVFGALKLYRLSNARYASVNSTELMSRSFLRTLEEGLVEIGQNFVLTQDPPIKRPMQVGSRNQADVHYGSLSSNAIPLDDFKRNATRHFELRVWGPTKISWSTGRGPGQGVPVGRYRLTFKASLKDREAFQKQISLFKQDARRGERYIDRLMDEWDALYHAKARIAVQRGNGRRKQSLTYETLESVEIYDDVEKTYSVDFDMDTSGRIYLCFENGPVRERPSTVQFGVRLTPEQKDNYRLPRIEIRDIFVEKLEATPKGAYDVSRWPAAQRTAANLQARAADYANELVGRGRIPAAQIFATMPEGMTPTERFCETIKLTSMSPEYLYIEPSANDAAMARYVAYALLKGRPTPQFVDAFQRFRKGSATSAQLAKHIVTDPRFERFMTEFTGGWLVEDPLLDEKEFNHREKRTNYQQETIQYLLHIFRENRPIPEVFLSDYKVLNAEMAAHYRLNAADGNGNIYRDYPGTKGGVLKQVAFFKSQSDGIDGLPFRRGAWILENVFDQRMGNPPDNLPVTDEDADTKLLTFRAQTQFHSRNTGCYECHMAIDPVAFAFQHLDVLGKKIAEPEDDQVQEFFKRMKSTEKNQVRAFATQLIQYITGRETTIFDHGVIDDFLKSGSRNGYRSQSLMAHVLTRYFSREVQGR